MPKTQASEDFTTNFKLKRSKTSAALKGRTLSDEHKKRVSQGVRDAWTNRDRNGYNSRPKPTEETKKKMSESHKQRWDRIKEALKQVEENEGGN